MAENENRGFLGKNKFKKTDKHPDYTGVINFKGTEYRVAGWIRDSKQEEGEKYLSLSVDDEPKKEPEKKPEPISDGEVPF